MSYFEECLSLGQWLTQEDRRALYKYLLSSKNDFFNKEAKKLIRLGELNYSIANGEIFYFVAEGYLSYKARKLNTTEYTDCIRSLKLSKYKRRNIGRIKRFFAQSEVEVISNFPLPGGNDQTDISYSINTYAFYDLAYYSNGKSRVRGLINKIKIDDSQTLKKLQT